KNQTAPLPGDPKAGEALFFGSAQCSSCHMASGRGGFIAPELSTYGQNHSVEQIKSAIVNPAARESIRPLVTATTSNGESYQGIIRNEDNFSLQLQSEDGAFHFLSKADLKTIERGHDSIMPSDYSSRLSAAQLNNIVSYLRARTTRMKIRAWTYFHFQKRHSYRMTKKIKSVLAFGSLLVAFTISLPASAQKT